jgi:hypothetical protein
MRLGVPSQLDEVSRGMKDKNLQQASGASVTLSISPQLLNLPHDDRDWVLDLIAMFKKHEARITDNGWSP